MQKDKRDQIRFCLLSLIWHVCNLEIGSESKLTRQWTQHCAKN